MIYYISDLHFGHKNVIRFDGRPFADVDLMDETLIHNWNERVTADDTVYVLGDAFWKNEEGSLSIIKRLNGHKHLIQGNHDRVHGRLRFYWESIRDYAEVEDDGKLVILSHYPMPFYKNQHYGAIMLLNLYKKDMKEQEDVSPDYVGNLFDNIPPELSKHDKEFVMTHIDNSARLARYSKSIGWLDDAMIVNVARNVTEPSVALSLSMDMDRFKMYLGDTGLLINLAYADGSYFDNEYYQAIMMDKLHINEGMFIENIVAQCLRANGYKLRYHVKTDAEKKKTIREVDFLIRDKKKILPIEVKSSGNFTIKSLTDFRTVFSDKVGRGIVLHEGDIKKEGEITYLPYFMASIL